jgi:hypothetical protein
MRIFLRAPLVCRTIPIVILIMILSNDSGARGQQRHS